MSKRSREESRADRADRTAALLQEQKRTERRRAAGAIVAVVVAVAVVLGGGIWLQSRLDTTGDAPEAVPAGVEDYSVFVGDEDAPHTVTVYEDLQCPVCQVFEEATGDRLRPAVEAGEVRVEYRMVSFLDGASDNEYSSRALNAALAVLDTAGTEAFLDFHDTLFAEQPAEGGPGPEDDELIEKAVAAGASEDEVRPQVEDKVYEQWIENATDAMSQEGVNGTPTVFIDGEVVEGSAQDSADAVLALLS